MVHIMRPMWQKFHILNRTQVFGLSAICALVIAGAIGIVSIPADGTSLNRFLGPSRDLDPYINFGLAFVFIVPALLSYYHLGRLGILLGIAIGGFACFATWLCAIVVFGFEMLGRSKVIEGATYTCFCLLLSALAFMAHLKASNSRSVQNAQRLLRPSTPLPRP
jgi:hypothetical protein